MLEMDEFISDFLRQLEIFWLPYTISQLVSVLILICAWKNTRIARAILSIMFFLASFTNLYTSLTTPDIYLDYANFAIPIYKDFINGWFSEVYEIFVPLIAVGQFLIALGMLLNKPWLKWACIGTIVFLLSIAPLLVGSAFPFSITVSFAAWLILKKDNGNLLWK